MNKNKIMIVLSDEARAIAKEDAKMFNGNVSAYLTHLIINARNAATEKKPRKLTMKDIQPMQFDGIEGDILKRKPAKKTTPTA